jgi:hypothetical protein
VSIRTALEQAGAIKSFKEKTRAHFDKANFKGAYRYIDIGNLIRCLIG